MRIEKNRTRLLITEFNDIELRKIEDLVASLDNVYLYRDDDKKLIGLPTGMEKTLRNIFSRSTFIDNSKEYWPFAKIEPVNHNAQPRNQLQIDFIKFVIEHSNKGEKLAGILSPGQGKLHPYGTLIPTENGDIKIEDLKVGDRIFDENGKITTVVNIYPQGVKDVYKITFNDGRYSLCGDEHLWLTKTWSNGKYKVRRTIDMIDDFKHIDSNKVKRRESGVNCDVHVYKYRIPILSAPAQFKHQDVPIHPYVVGALIGNGCLTLPYLKISSGDTFVPNKVASIIGTTAKKENGSYSYTFRTADKILKTKEFLKDLPELIGSYSRDKVIPDIYIYNDVETRIELLRGLMDTDGSIRYNDGRFHVTYSSCSEKLLRQIQYIIQSLGFNTSEPMVDKRKEKYRNGYHAEILLKVPNSFKHKLFSHPSKLKIAMRANDYPDSGNNDNHLMIKDIKLVDKAPSICIAVDNPSHLYLTENFIVTHNTFMACYSAIKMGQRTLIIVPTSGIKQQWYDTLVGMFGVPKERVKNITSPRDFFNVDADFVVVSQASLASLNKNYDLEKIMKLNKFGIKVIDEVQMWFHNIIRVDACCNFYNNWYLTGTFGRSGQTENSIYQEMFGDLAMFREEQKKPTIFDRKPGNVYGMKPHMHVKMMWTSSGLTKEQIQKITNSMRYSEREGRWIRYGISIPAYTSLIIPEDGTMTKMLDIILKVIKMADKEVDYGRMLILGSTISSAEVIASYCRKMFPNMKIGTFHSRNAKIDNAKNIAESDILVSTIKSAGTGFDMKDLSKLVVCAAFASWILTDQVSGRLRRRPDGKDTYMWDIVDADIKQLRVWANTRADVLKDKSKTFKVVDIK